MQQHAQYVNNMKTWLQQRINWLNNNIGSDQSCADVDLPPLVISKIHYHPMDWWGYSGELFEFIEITNNGDVDVDLTGIYFRELGVTYRFPNGSHLAAREALMLCSDSLSFVEHYNTVPFGQYTRKLSNKSENLVLADAWGNIIDEVHYYDSDPWPTEPDGNGPYLELKDLDFDNSLAESWTIGDDLTHVQHDYSNQIVAVHPNPTDGVVHISAEETIILCQLFDLMGNKVMSMQPMKPGFELDLSHLSSGLYLLKTQAVNGQNLFGKVVKQ